MIFDNEQSRHRVFFKRKNCFDYTKKAQSSQGVLLVQ